MTYNYRCKQCGEFVVEKRISDPPVDNCIYCNALVERVFKPIGVSFRGSGFYCTDARKKETTNDTE